MSITNTSAVMFSGLDSRLDACNGEVLRSLRRKPKRLPCKLFYDQRGSQLFDEICELDEYYPTRTEMAIMRDHARDIADCVGPRAMLIEYGSGSNTKTRILLDHLHDRACHVPIDISREHLIQSATKLSEAYPQVQVNAVCADYTRRFDLPECHEARRRIVYFPGSTIGNFHHHRARLFLRRIAVACGPGGALIIGIDLKKDPLLLHRAYNDRHGVTAAFNLNMLARLNRELDADFDLDAFRHYAFYNAERGRIEMHLVSRRPQDVHLDGETIPFELGESIRTECSYKYTIEQFADLADGLAIEGVWTDARRFFAVLYLTVKSTAKTRKGNGPRMAEPGH